MTFIANTPDDVRGMLEAIGVNDIDALFADVPAEVRLDRPVGPERPLSELELLRLARDRAAQNRPAAGAYRGFMGAGAYEHFIPAAVPALAQRGEYLTAYTPYQGEASQGTLQVIYEFQSMIGALTGLEAANASLYDGASALAEAVLMAVRLTDRDRAVLPATLHPHYADVVRTYARNLGIALETWPADSACGGGALDPDAAPEAGDNLAAVVVQQPNVFGFLEDVEPMVRAARERGALVIAAVNPMSLVALAPPGAWGADIAVGELQPLGLPLAFGGPYAGFMAARREHIRKMPGRIVGRTRDAAGRDAFVLTLQTREQHIRRERATSNICTNQGLCASMATFYMALVGKSGFERLGDLNLDRAGRLFDGLRDLPGVEPLCDAPFFNEFTIRLDRDAEAFCREMKARGVLAGVPATRLSFDDPRLLIVCATETKTDGDLEAWLRAAAEILKPR